MTFLRSTHIPACFAFVALKRRIEQAEPLEKQSKCPKLQEFCNSRHEQLEVVFLPPVVKVPPNVWIVANKTGIGGPTVLLQITCLTACPFKYLKTDEI